MGRVQKIGVAAFERKNPDSAFFIRQRDGLKSSHATLQEIMLELRTSLFALGFDLLAMLADERRFPKQRRPLQDMAQGFDLRIGRVELGYPGNRPQLDTPALF